jgi:hypothetical protein
MVPLHKDSAQLEIFVHSYHALKQGPMSDILRTLSSGRLDSDVWTLPLHCYNTGISKSEVGISIRTVHSVANVA